MNSDDSAEITPRWRETLERVALVVATLILLVVPPGLFVGWMPTLIHLSFTVMGLLGLFAIAKCLDLRERFEGHRRLQHLMAALAIVILIVWMALQNWLMPEWLKEQMFERRP